MISAMPPARDPVDPTMAALLVWSRSTHLFPQGYTRGINWLLGQNDTRPAFLNGRWKVGGWRRFFACAFWLKTQPALLLLLLLGLGGWWWLKRMRRIRPDASAAVVPSFYRAIPYFTLIVVYFTIAVMQKIDIGHRHLLPIYPAMYILGGTVGLLWPLHVRWKWTGIAPALLMLWLAFDSLAVYPHYLAYFSPLAGGPPHGYKHLIDSSLDWGMDLPGLKRWLARRNPDGQKPVFLAYFGTDSPKYYGIKCRRLPGFFDWHRSPPYALAPGIYAISATLLQSVYTDTFGPWNKVYEEKYQECLRSFEAFDATAGHPEERAALLKKYPMEFWDRQYDVFAKLRFGRLCAWLRHEGDPPYNVGHAILIWTLDASELHDVLFGPPAELEDAATGDRPPVDRHAVHPDSRAPRESRA